MNISPSNDTQDPEKVTDIISQKTEPSHKRKKILVIAILVTVLVAIGIGLYILFKPSTDGTKTPVVTEEKSPIATEPIDCPDSYRVFADHDFGMAFCYPSEWGDAAVQDAKVGPADTGHRESIMFADMPFYSVGGTSDDWSTTVGRDVGCLEPNNATLPLSDYNTSWHGITGSGAEVNFAMRSLPSPTGGYDSTETVSDVIQSGVCAQAHKVINGTRYRVAFAAYYHDFAEASGITTPSQHMDHPEVLFSASQRQQFDAVLASIVAY